MSNIFPWFFLTFSFSLIQISAHFAKIYPATIYLNPPPEMLEKFTFGFNESTADSIWLRWVQDSDTCQTYLKPVEEFDTRNFNQESEENRFIAPRKKNCDNSWAFKMLDAVTKLSPKFKMPYLAGAITLSVLTEDYIGASEIFDRGLKQYPDDWQLAYRASYHYLFDMGDKKRAAELLIQAQKDPKAPGWFNYLAARLYSEAGQAELGVSVLENYRKTLDEEKQIEAVDKRIADLKAKLQP